MSILDLLREQDGDDLAHCIDSFENGDFIMAAEIVKQEDFNNYEDDHRVVRLSSSYGRWSFQEMLATFVPPSGYMCNLQRVQENGKVKKLSISPRELDTLCEAWAQFKADFEKHNSVE